MVRKSLEWIYMVKYNSFGNQSGQIGLVVLLIGAVLMTIGIGAVSQSIIETKTAKQEEESSQAFNLAEQGIEGILDSALPETATSDQELDLPDGYEGSYSITPNIIFKTTIPEGHSGNVILPVSNPGTLTINWTNTGNCTSQAAIIVAIVSETSVRRYYYRPTDCFEAAPTLATGFTEAANTASVPFNVGDELARIKVLYATTELTVSGTNVTQQHDIQAEARNQSTLETRVVSVTKMRPSAPGIFDYALFSGTGIGP
jgi:hypothetical protein